jgi:hypothetical protein
VNPTITRLDLKAQDSTMERKDVSEMIMCGYMIKKMHKAIWTLIP